MKKWLVLLVLLCTSCATTRYGKTESGEPTAFGPKPKPFLASRAWTKMNPLYNPNWGTGKKIAYVVSPLGH